MTTQELHIHLDLLLQKVSSNWNKNFLPQEKDIFINREITKFLKQRINPLSNRKKLAMFDTLKRVQDTNTLLKTVPLPVVAINEEEVGYRLPFDFLYYISSSVNVIPVCAKDTIPPSTLPKIIYCKSFKPLTTIADVTSCVLTLIVGTDHTVLFDLSFLPPTYLPQDNIADYKKAFILNNAIAVIAKRNCPKGVEFRFNNDTGTFQIKSDSNFGITFVVNTVPKPINILDKVTSVYTGLKTLKSAVEIIDEEYKAMIQGSYLSNTKGKHTKGYLRADRILIPISPSVLVKSAVLTYICKPTKVDLLLNSNSELPDEILDEVISNVAESLKAVISSDTYEKYVADNSLIE